MIWLTTSYLFLMPNVRNHPIATSNILLLTMLARFESSGKYPTDEHTISLSISDMDEENPLQGSRLVVEQRPTTCTITSVSPVRELEVATLWV